MVRGTNLHIGISIAAALALLGIIFYSARRGQAREGIHKTRTMTQCAERCADGDAGGSCVQACCTQHCDKAKRTTQGCIHYCHTQSRQRNTPRRILPHVSTYPTHTDSNTPPLASSATAWPTVESAHGKPLGNHPLPPHARLLVPSVAQQEHGPTGWSTKPPPSLGPDLGTMNPGPLQKLRWG